MANELDKFLGETSEKEEDLFGTQEETVTEEQSEETEEVKKEEEKPLPFNKDPKVQRFIEKQIEKRMASMGTVEKEFVKETKPEDDDYYVRLIGNDTPEKVAMIKEAQRREERQLQIAEERAFNRLSSEKQKEIESERQAEKELETALDDIEENYDIDITSNDPVAKKTRVDFLKFVERIAPKNRAGEISEYPDMSQAFETFQEMRKTAKPESRAKDLSARSMSRSAETSTKVTGGQSWKDVERIFEKISN